MPAILHSSSLGRWPVSRWYDERMLAVRNRHAERPPRYQKPARRTGLPANGVDAGASTFKGVRYVRRHPGCQARARARPAAAPDGDGEEGIVERARTSHEADSRSEASAEDEANVVAKAHVPEARAQGWLRIDHRVHRRVRQLLRAHRRHCHRVVSECWGEERQPPKSRCPSFTPAPRTSGE